MISFEEVALDDAKSILEWRTSSRITKFMTSDIEYNLEKQRQWIQSCYEKEDYYHWIIKIEGKPAGLINIYDYDPVGKNSSWGFYIGEDNLIGYGAFIPPKLYNFCFAQLGFKYIKAEVFYENINVIKLHQLHGYKFSPIKDRIIVKNGKEILLIGMTLSALDWNNNIKYKNQVACFPTKRWLLRPVHLLELNC